MFGLEAKIGTPSLRVSGPQYGMLNLETRDGPINARIHKVSFADPTTAPSHVFLYRNDDVCIPAIIVAAQLRVLSRTSTTMHFALSEYTSCAYVHN